MTKTTYNDVSGPFVNGTTALSSANLEPIRDFLTAAGAMWDSNVSVDGSGNMSLVGLIASGQIQPNKAGTVTNGTSGTITWFTPVWGTGLKILVAYLNNYQNSSVVSFNLPSVMNVGFFVTGNFGSATQTISFFRSGSAQSIRAITGFAGTGGGTLSSEANVYQATIGITGAIDQVQVGNTGGAITTFILFVGA